SSGRSDEARRLLEPLLADCPEGRLLWMFVAGAHATEASAVAWIDRVAPGVPADSLVERVALARAWNKTAATFSSIPCWKKSNEVLHPLLERPDIGADVWDLFAQSALQLADYDDAERA